MSLQEATEAQLPFGMGEVDLTSPMMVIATIISFIAGWAIFSWTQDVGDHVADVGNDVFAQFTGTNPATGGDGALDGV